jgi:hypothetical protein
MTSTSQRAAGPKQAQQAGSAAAVVTYDTGLGSLDRPLTVAYYYHPAKEQAVESQVRAAIAAALRAAVAAATGGKLPLVGGEETSSTASRAASNTTGSSSENRVPDAPSGSAYQYVRDGDRSAAVVGSLLAAAERARSGAGTVGPLAADATAHSADDKAATVLIATAAKEAIRAHRK